MLYLSIWFFSFALANIFLVAAIKFHKKDFFIPTWEEALKGVQIIILCMIFATLNCIFFVLLFNQI
jgi:hypothetical protein